MACHWIGTAKQAGGVCAAGWLLLINSASSPLTLGSVADAARPACPELVPSLARGEAEGNERSESKGGARKSGVTDAGYRQARHATLLCDFDALPERYVVLDVAGRFFGIGIIPSRVRVGFSVDDDVVITRLAFPRASRVGIAFLEVITVNA